MGSTRRVAMAVAVIAVLGAAMIGTAAVAQQDAAPPATADPAVLLQRLAVLEPGLPEVIPPTGVGLDEELTWGTFGGDAAGANAVLEINEAELRAVFTAADDAGTELGDAVALVARGWLDVWHGTAALADHSANDLEYPVGTFNAEDVATGADEIRGVAVTGLELILQGRARHLEGYTTLRELGAADPADQAWFDARAADAEIFDQDVRPLLERFLSSPTTSVAVPTDRFDSSAPGVEPRATSVTFICVDRQLLEEHGPASDEQLEALEAASPDRADCPDLADEE